MCLAAGAGTRFGRLGTYLQKCMYPVGLRPFVAYSVRNLMRSRGFDPNRDRLTFVVGHHAEQVRAYFGDAWGDDADADPAPVRVRVRYVEQAEQLGTGHALHMAARDLVPDGPIVAWLADLYVPADLFTRIREHPEQNVLAVGPDPHADNPDVAVDLVGDRLVRAWQGSGPNYDIGLWKLGREALAAMLGRRLDEYRALPSLQRLIDEERAEVGWVQADAWIHLGGTAPTVERNVRSVVGTIMDRESPE